MPFNSVGQNSFLNALTNSISILSSQTIDCTATGTSLVSKIGDTGRFIIVAFFLILDDVAGPTVSGNEPFISLGTNNPDYNDIAADAQLSGIDSQYQVGGFNSSAFSFPPGTEIKAKVNTAAVPVNVTTYTITIFCLGFYY